MAEKEKEDKEEIVPVGPGADEEDLREESEERVEERAESEDEGEEERLGHEEGDQGEDREEVRRRRRAEKQRKKENRNRDRLELNFLRQRNEQLERRQSELDARVANGEMVLIDNKVAELDNQIREAERLKALAINKADGESAAEADRIANDLRAGRNQLAQMKNQRIAAARAAPQPTIDPNIQARAVEWAEDHSWYDPQLRNEDSRVAKAVEDALFQEGRFDAREPEYWDELNRRLKKYLPERFGNGEDREEREERRTPRGPTVRVGGRERPLRRNEVYISPERKAALVEAGAWEDPVLREKYLKQYQKYDREQRRH